VIPDVPGYQVDRRRLALAGGASQRRQPNPSHRPCARPHDLASVSMTVRPFSKSLRQAPVPVSINVRRKPPLIARRGNHHCAPLQVVRHHEVEDGLACFRFAQHDLALIEGRCKL